MTLPACGRCGCELVAGYCSATPRYHTEHPMPGCENVKGARPLTAEEWNRWRRAGRPDKPPKPDFKARAAGES